MHKRAKELRKKHPNMKYQTALKEAGREFRSGKKVSSKKKAAPKKTTRRRVGAVKYSGGSVSIGSTMTAAQHKAALCRKIEEELGRAYVTRDRQTTKTGRRAAEKKITALRAKYRIAEKL